MIFLSFAVVDWGYASDYVRAMTRILQLDVSDDFVIATGLPHTVQDFVAAAFNAVDLDWRPYVVENPAIIVKNTARLIGNPARLHSRTGWRPSVTFEQMVALLVRHEAQRQALPL